MVGERNIGKGVWVMAVLLGIGVIGGPNASPPAMAKDPVKIGLVAALSGASAKSGEAITRGLEIAIDEINGRGGVLGGQKLELIRRDDESNPARGQTAARELIFKEKVAAFFGGLDSPVSLAIVPVTNKEKVPFMGVWAAATPITRNASDSMCSAAPTGSRTPKSRCAATAPRNATRASSRTSSGEIQRPRATSKLRANQKSASRAGLSPAVPSRQWPAVTTTSLATQNAVHTVCRLRL